MKPTGSTVLAALAALALVLAVGLAGCGDKVTAPPAATPMPDFSLTDDNPASATHGQAVSPRRFLGQVSGWYFGHST